MRHMLAGSATARLFLLAAGMALGVGSCATNPVTGQRQFTLLSEAQEIRMGRDYDPQIVAEMGLVDDAALQAYVHELGGRMAAASERPDLPWTFRVLDDPLVNAFAVPGGYIYVTRGILAHFNSEAELAAVLGHEIGHVTARHSVARMSAQQLAQFGLVLGTVLRPDLETVAEITGAGLGLLFLKYSRDDERQADDLGLRYMVEAGYHPGQMARVFEMLEAVSGGEGQDRGPEWLATHPNPGNRRERIAQQVGELPPSAMDGRIGRAEYLERIDGIIYGENPREGFFRGNQFLHPDMRFRFAFPEGWTTANRKQAVLAVSPRRDAIVQITLARESTPDAAAHAFFSQQAVTGGRPGRGSINGMAAVGGDFTAATQDGPLRGTVAFLSYGDAVYQLLAYAPEGRWSAYESAARRAIRSFDRLTDADALAVQPLRIEIVTLPRAMSMEEFARAYPSPLPTERLALLNGVGTGDTLPAGRQVKRVVGQLAR